MGGRVGEGRQVGVRSEKRTQRRWEGEDSGRWW